MRTFALIAIGGSLSAAVATSFVPHALVQNWASATGNALLGTEVFHHHSLVREANPPGTEYNLRERSLDDSAPLGFPHYGTESRSVRRSLAAEASAGGTAAGGAPNAGSPFSADGPGLALISAAGSGNGAGSAATSATTKAPLRAANAAPETAASPCGDAPCAAALVVDVPEPDTWALMVVAFAGLGAALRQRMSRPAAAVEA